MEEHLRPQEPLVANIDVNHVAVDGLVHEVLELLGLLETAVFVGDLLVIQLELLEYILADVPVLFLDLASNLSRILSLELFATILQHLKSELGDVSSSKRDALDAAANHIAVANWEDVRNAVTCIDNSASQVTRFNLIKMLRVGAS